VTSTFAFFYGFLCAFCGDGVGVVVAGVLQGCFLSMYGGGCGRPEPVFPPALEQKSDAEAPGVSRSFATRSHMHTTISGPNVLVVEARFHRSWSNNFAARGRVYLPRGIVISVPGGGVNPNVDGGIGPVTWFEYVVTMRSPFGCNISVRCARDSALI
jgi:hypothetical protein